VQGSRPSQPVPAACHPSIPRMCWARWAS
jgi:hypothetical protein